jgi:hypothetical protein
MNAITPTRRPAEPTTGRLPTLISGPGVHLVWRPALCPLETRLALARKVLEGTGHTIQEPR